MKTTLAIAALLAAAAHAFAGTGATQTWVANFVTNYVDAAIVATRPVAGGTAFTAGDETIVLEEATVPALVVHDPRPAALSAGLSDGSLFAWSESDGAWRHGQLLMLTSRTNALVVVGGTPYSWASWRPGLWLCDAQTNWLCRIASTTVARPTAQLAWEGRR